MNTLDATGTLLEPLQLYGLAISPPILWAQLDNCGNEA